MALATVSELTFTYPRSTRPAVADITLELHEGEVVTLLGPSGSGKSTLIRALAGLVPHFHGGRFAGQVVVGGRDTRRARPADLAGTVATVFQDPEEQVVMTTVENEIAFGLENIGTPPRDIRPRAAEALAAVGALHLTGRRTAELSGGELQRVCLASALALRPSLLLLDEPTSQLDPDGADAFFDALAASPACVVLSEQRTERALALADRVLFVDGGRLLLDAPRERALAWLAEQRPAFVSVEDVRIPESGVGTQAAAEELVLSVQDASFAYGQVPVLDRVCLEVRRGEVVALEGPNGIGKTTLAKLAAGLLEPTAGHVQRAGRACYLSQDPGRYLVRDRVDEEVAIGAHGDIARARRALAAVELEWAALRHPRDLSSGERERLGLAAVAVSEPDLLVLDEPTRGIDPERKRLIGEWLERYVAAGRGVLVATHDRSFPCDRRVALGSREAVVV